MNVGTNGNCGRPESDHVREVVRSAEEELRQLLRQRAEVMKRIGTIKQTLAGLANIFGRDVLSEDLLTLVGGRPAARQSGFTRACRLVLMDSERPMNARQVCDQLQKKFPDILGAHRSPVASVTTVLGRLVGYSEASSSVDSNGRRVWTWLSAPPRDKPRLNN
jgi:chorismate mutase